MTDAHGTTTYSYDVRDRLKTKTAPHGTLTYAYDPTGNIGYEDYAAGLSTSRKHIYKLDQKGSRVAYRIEQPDGKAGDEKYVYKYDGNGNLIVEELYYKTTLISRNENTYDQQGQLISQVSYNPDSTVSSRIRVLFAADDKPKEMLIYNQDGSLRERVVIEYDSRGNWTKRTRRVKAAPAGNEVTRQIDYRTITYQ